MPPGKSAVLNLAHLVERLSQMARDVELVEQDRRLRRPGLRVHATAATAELFLVWSFDPSS
jgi:hypothetical protein